MNHADLAEKYINDHNNPITKKSELFGSKLFLASLNEQQEHLKEKCLGRIQRILRHDRVDRRVARSTAEWIPEKNIAKVTKITGASAEFGIQNKNGKFLNPEETLFLMEMNKLDLTYQNAPVSIEQAYKNVVNLEKYLSYKKLAVQGYKLKSKDSNQSKQKKEENTSEMPTRSEETDEEPPAKIAKVDEQNDMKEMFEKLRQNGPRSFSYEKDISQLPDYYVNMPTDKSGCFNLNIVNEGEFKSTLDKKNEDVFALACDDNVAFYKFYNVNVQILE